MRRTLVPLSLILLSALSAAPTTVVAAPAAHAASAPLYDAGIARLETKMQAGTLTSAQLTAMFIHRIDTLDRAGPHLDAVIELNPDAMAIARRIDAERRAGKPLGPLAGIPVLLKDNIDTGDRMQTTAGSLALVGRPAATDATLVARLRAAGAVILGKTNLSEWANYRSNHSTSGWSGRGGQTRNPYVLSRNPCGSSSGSAVAVSAGLTHGRGRQRNRRLAGLPGLGQRHRRDQAHAGPDQPRTGIVPISHSQDTAGPMARDVADAARLLTVMAGSDPADPASADANAHKTDYTTLPQGRRPQGQAHRRGARAGW